MFLLFSFFSQRITRFCVPVSVFFYCPNLAGVYHDGSSFPPQFPLCTFFPIPLFTKWGTTAVYLIICSLWELEFAQWCRFYLLLIDQKLLRGGGGPLRSYINNTQLVSFLSFSSFISQYVVCLHVLLWLPGGGWVGRKKF